MNNTSYTAWQAMQLEPDSVIITGNRKRYKEWPVYVDQRSEVSKRLDALTLNELEEIENNHLKKHNQ